MGLTEQKNILSTITSEVKQVKSALEIIKKEQAKQINAFEELMTMVKEGTESIESNFKPVMAMFVLVIIVIAVLAVAIRFCLL